MLQALDGGGSLVPYMEHGQGSRLVLRAQRSVGLPWWLRGKESACRCTSLRFDPWVGEDPLEKEMATHSSILAWEISWLEEPGGLQPTGSQESDTTQLLNNKSKVWLGRQT